GTAHHQYDISLMLQEELEEDAGQVEANISLQDGAQDQLIPPTPISDTAEPQAGIPSSDKDDRLDAAPEPELTTSTDDKRNAEKQAIRPTDKRPETDSQTDAPEPTSLNGSATSADNPARNETDAQSVLVPVLKVQTLPSVMESPSPSKVIA